MSDARLLRKLNDVVARIQRQRSLRVSFLCWLALLIVLLVLLAEGSSRLTLAKVLAAGIPASLLCSIVAGRARASDRQQAALNLERTFPELDTMLLASLNQRPGSDTWEFSFLQSELLSKVLDHARNHDWRSAISGLRTLQLSRIAVMLACLILIFKAPQQTSSAVPELEDEIAVETPVDQAIPIEIVVDPGNTEVERGSSLLVLARFGKRLPRSVTLVATDQQNREQRIPLNKSLDDPIFGGRIPEIMEDLKYRIEFDTDSSEDFSVSTFTYPELLKADAALEFPEYTSLDPKVLEDVRRVSVVQGTSLTFDFQMNKPLKSAVLVDESGQRQELTLADSSPLKTQFNLTPTTPEKKTYQLELIDIDGRMNRNVPEFVITVAENKQPDLKVTFPARDVRVSQLEELSLQAKASDDFGLVEYGLVFETPDGTQQSMTLGKEAERDKKTTIDHLLAIESLNVQPDELISYYFYADDVGPDGEQRRAFSDIFFSEVRRFEEIFREVPPNAAQQQQQQQQQQGETESGELVEVQRQIVTATWNLIRSEPRTQPSPQFLPSAEVLFDSQEQALVMAEQLKERLDDEDMLSSLNEAMEFMTSTSRFFAEAISKERVASLHDARSKGQAAYQALLRLNSQEKKVQQSQQSQQSRSQNSRQQDRNRQMKALELKNDRDRYETERQAQQQQAQEERETLQVLNRLRELARRQEDLNEKIRDLENKLREADSEEERTQLERELKRLQEEQEELLRNLDELRERMNQDENRERMADAREQVEETRERVLRASEALKQEQTSRALSEGTRAQRELEELKEEFKQQTANQFADAVKELRNQARDLARDQEQLGESMNSSPENESPSERPSLRSTDKSEARQEISEQLDTQRNRLTELLDRTKNLVEESEDSEPLLSQKLYDTMRDLRKYDPEEALRGASQLQRYGIDDEARKAEAQAREGIKQFEKGIEQAAQSILGDESDALAAANDVLDELTKAIENELQQNSGQGQQQPGQQQPGQQQPGQQQPGQQQPGQQQPGQQQPGQQQPGQQQPGQQQPGQQQPGQQQPGQQQPGQQQPGQQPGQQQPGRSNSQSNGGNLGSQLGNLFNETGSPNADNGGFENARPLTGDEFQNWSDRMRDLEEMVPTPELRSQVATIRDRARQMRIDLKRHSKSPDWDLVKSSIYGPMVELQKVIAEELAKRDPNERLVPIDRDPVPDQYTELLQRYYEELARERVTNAP